MPSNKIIIEIIKSYLTVYLLFKLTQLIYLFINKKLPHS
jgi:hypothetical protein